MRSVAKVAVLAGCLLAHGSLGTTAATKSTAHTFTVTIENLQFRPAELTVRRGDRIIWVNKDFFPHTATANDKAFDSGSISSNGNWTLTASTVGDHSYICTF